jgi:hypothetical protein
MELDDKYLREALSNGQPREQALIRQWWQKEKGGRGCLIWEYYLGGRFLDALWLPGETEACKEHHGTGITQKFPIAGKTVVLCEAKLQLTPELIGQALVYRSFALRLGANVHSTVIFAETATDDMRQAAADLGLFAVVAKAPPTAMPPPPQDPLPTPDARELMEYMSDLSEEAYCAGWMANLEYELWAAVTGGPTKYGRAVVDAFAIDKLQRLSNQCGGWIVFDDEAGPRWLPLEDWRRRFAEWRG